MKKVNIDMKIILMVFSKKILQGKWAILGPKMLHGYNLESVLRIFLKKSCTIKEANGYIKIISVVFLKKTLIWSNWGFWAPE